MGSYVPIVDISGLWSTCVDGSCSCLVCVSTRITILACQIDNGADMPVMMFDSSTLVFDVWVFVGVNDNSGIFFAFVGLIIFCRYVCMRCCLLIPLTLLAALSFVYFDFVSIA